MELVYLWKTYQEWDSGYLLLLIAQTSIAVQALCHKTCMTDEQFVGIAVVLGLACGVRLGRPRRGMQATLHPLLPLLPL
jgi:hypothetical protein